METQLQIDRLAMRGRPEGEPIIRQNWEDLLFLHWPIDPAELRPLIPPHLEIDTFDGKAWIGLTPFRLTGLRVSVLPQVPGLNVFEEMNVRTYVHHHGKPGIWFFSLDASKLVPALAARLFFALPYFPANIDFSNSGGRFSFLLNRTAGPNASFRADWRTGVRLRDPDVESLAFFLVERYCFFSVQETAVQMTRIYHHPWILDEAVVGSCESHMLQGLGLTEPTDPPIAHFSKFLDVEIWPPVNV